MSYNKLPDGSDYLTYRSLNKGYVCCKAKISVTNKRSTTGNWALQKFLGLTPQSQYAKLLKILAIKLAT